MAKFKHLNVQQLKQWLDANHPVRLVDIRDPQAFSQGHIMNSFHLMNETFQYFVDHSEFEETVIVVCYHGNSSQKVAQDLVDFGYDDVYSLDGGYKAWSEAFG